MTVADEKRIVEDQRRALDEEIADFQRRKAQVILISHWSMLLETLSSHWSVRERQDELRSPHADPGQARQEEVICCQDSVKSEECAVFYNAFLLSTNNAYLSTYLKVANYLVEILFRNRTPTIV